MAWIESHQSLLSHRKTLRASGLLHISKVLMIGHLHVLWWWALDNVAADGDLGDMTDEEIAAAALWDRPKRAADFVFALTQSGFIDAGPVSRRLHKWGEYAGRLHDLREKRSEAGRIGGLASGEARRSNREATVQQPLKQNEAPTNLTSPHQPTNQPTGPDQPAKPSSLAAYMRRTEMTLITDEQFEQLRPLFPTEDLSQRHTEWRLWIEEEEEKRKPENAFSAFKGFLNKKVKESAGSLAKGTGS